MSENFDFEAEFKRHSARAYLGFLLILVAAVVMLNAYFAWFQIPPRLAQGAFAVLAATGLCLWVQGQKRLADLKERWNREFEAERERRFGPPPDHREDE